MKHPKNRYHNFNNFEAIRSEVEQNIADGVQSMPVVVQPRPKFKRIAILATCALLLCALSVGSTLGITQYVYAAEARKTYSSMEEYWKDRIYYGSYKNRYDINYFFDEFVAFGGAAENNVITANQVQGLTFISEADKKTFNNYVTSSINNGQDSYLIYLGSKNGEDKVVLIQQAKVINDFGDPMLGIPDPDHHACYFAFKSTANYAFADVVKAFEELSGETLTQEYLRDCGLFKYPRDPYYWQWPGITLTLRWARDEEYYQEYHVSSYTEYREAFFAEINGQIYGLTREMLLARVNAE